MFKCPNLNCPNCLLLSEIKKNLVANGWEWRSYPVYPFSSIAPIKPKCIKYRRKHVQMENKIFIRFMVHLFLYDIISEADDWKINRLLMRTEFIRYIGSPDHIVDKFLLNNDNIYSIAKVLDRNDFLLKTKRNCEYYHINHVTLMEHVGRILQICEPECKRLEEFGARYTEVLRHSKYNMDMIDSSMAYLFKVDLRSPKYKLTFKANRQELNRKPNFVVSSMGCYICQENFNSSSDLKNHIKYHSIKSNFQSIRMLVKPNSPDSDRCFKLSYKICINSHYFCFTLENNSADSSFVIDKIFVIQPHVMYSVEKPHLPFNLSGTESVNFFVDSQMFTMNQEMPIVIMCRKLESCGMRIMEQHHFLRTEEFPQISVSKWTEEFHRSYKLGSYRRHLMSNILLGKPNFLADFLPTEKMSLELNQRNLKKVMMEMSEHFQDYMTQDKVFTLNNQVHAMKMLLQLEDVESIRSFANFVQRAVQLTKLRFDTYSLNFRINAGVCFRTIKKTLSSCTDVIVMRETDVLDMSTENLHMHLLLDNYDEVNQKKRCYVGQITNVSDLLVTFKCHKKIPINEKFTIVFRPQRHPIRLQYHALNLYHEMPMCIKKPFFFPDSVEPIELPNTKLEIHNKSILTNPEQLQAVRNIADGPRKGATYIIFGPPGTGKTTTIVESVLQLYLRRPDTKILIMAGSNSACDEIALRLYKIIAPLYDQNGIVRIYARTYENHSNKIDKQLLECSNMYDKHFYPATYLIHKYRVAVCTLSVVGKLTLNDFGKDRFGDSIYTHIFIDNAAAVTEPEALVGLANTLSSKASLILAGDHKQIGSMLQSKCAQKFGFGVSLMERLLSRDCYRVDEDGNYDRTIQTRLLRNYRSHPAIVNVFSSMYYNKELIALSGDDILLKWSEMPNSNYPILFHSVFGKFKRRKYSSSIYNNSEVDVVIDYVKKLINSDVSGRKIKQSDIGVVSPYKAQYEMIRRKLQWHGWNQIETGSVELFQGKEKLIIITSLARTSSKTLDSLLNSKRLNVTLSRSKSLLIMIGNAKTLCLNSDIKHIIQMCKSQNNLVGKIDEELKNMLVEPLLPSSSNTNPQEIEAEDLDETLKEDDTDMKSTEEINVNESSSTSTSDSDDSESDDSDSDESDSDDSESDDSDSDDSDSDESDSDESDSDDSDSDDSDGGDSDSDDSDGGDSASSNNDSSDRVSSDNDSSNNDSSDRVSSDNDSSDSVRSDSANSDNASSDSARSDNASSDNDSSDSVSSDSASSDNDSSDSVSSDSASIDSASSDSASSDSASSDSASSDSASSDSASSDSASSDNDSSDSDSSDSDNDSSDSDSGDCISGDSGSSSDCSSGSNSRSSGRSSASSSNCSMYTAVNDQDERSICKVDYFSDSDDVFLSAEDDNNNDSDCDVFNEIDPLINQVNELNIVTELGEAFNEFEQFNVTNNIDSDDIDFDDIDFDAIDFDAIDFDDIELIDLLNGLFDAFENLQRLFEMPTQVKSYDMDEDKLQKKKRSTWTLEKPLLSVATETADSVEQLTDDAASQNINLSSISTYTDVNDEDQEQRQPENEEAKDLTYPSFDNSSSNYYISLAEVEAVFIAARTLLELKNSSFTEDSNGDGKSILILNLELPLTPIATETAISVEQLTDDAASHNSNLLPSEGSSSTDTDVNVQDESQPQPETEEVEDLNTEEENLQEESILPQNLKTPLSSVITETTVDVEQLAADAAVASAIASAIASAMTAPATDTQYPEQYYRKYMSMIYLPAKLFSPSLSIVTGIPLQNTDTQISSEVYDEIGQVPDECDSTTTSLSLSWEHTTCPTSLTDSESNHDQNNVSEIKVYQDEEEEVKSKKVKIKSSCVIA